MSSAPSASGRVLHRLCPGCDKEIAEAIATCPTCGSKLVEIRDEADAVIGSVIDGRFEVRDKIGQGGMGSVYRAWQRSIGREVAIKLIDRSFSRDPMAVRRFLREARLASQLSQPNTVSVFDFGQAEDGRLFMAMELIRGRTLYNVLQADGPFSLARMRHVATQICDALEAAHGIGILHRDLKLDNVIVLDHPPGRDLVKVLDFGLAKSMREPMSRATESGVVVGTPRYMAPEAAMSGEYVPAGDVYALGVIIGELATGKPLWVGDTLAQLIHQKLDITAAIARVPRALKPLVKALIDPEPTRRPTVEKAREMLAALATTSDDMVLPAAPTPNVTANLRAQREEMSDAQLGEASTTPQPGVFSDTQLAPTTPSNLVGRESGAPRPLAVTSSPAAPATAVPTSGAPAPAPASGAPVPTSGAAVPTSGAPVPTSGAAAPTTGVPGPMSGAVSGAGAPVSSRSRTRMFAIVGAGLALAGVAAIAIAMSSGSDDKPKPREPAVATPPSPPPAVTPDAAVEVASADAAVVAPATVTAHVESDPAGATVAYRGKTYKTPFDIVLERGEQPIELVAHKRGYTAKKITIKPTADSRHSVMLVRPKQTTDNQTPF